MKVFAGGVRGSWPIADASCLRYGGETTSILVEGDGGGRAVIDLGSGVRRVARRLRDQGMEDVLALLTHTHLDHILGLPSFSLLHSPTARVRFASPDRDGMPVGEVLSRLLEAPFWPMPLSRHRADITSIRLNASADGGPLRERDLEVRWAPVRHDGGCAVYRIDEPSTGAAVAVATDLEWGAMEEGERGALLRLLAEPKPVGLLLFDGHVPPAEAARYRGWGHSSWRDGVDAARRSGAGRLALIHHAQFHTDVDIAALEADCRREMESARFAREGTLWVLDGATAREKTP
jgi:ribonuclease BN (tRNA processing enzyme)